VITARGWIERYVGREVWEKVWSPMLRAKFGERADGLAARMRSDYLRRLRASEYHTALCMVLELDRPLTRNYWTNVIDPERPFCGVVEHANLIEPERYGGRRFVYVAKLHLLRRRAARPQPR
jgi:protoporphyrinogen oxidase